MKEFNFKELEKISGGGLTIECREWIDRNFDVIRQRIIDSGKFIQSKDFIYNIHWDEKTYSLNEFKEKIKEFGVDCDDLI